MSYRLVGALLPLLVLVLLTGCETNKPAAPTDDVAFTGEPVILDGTAPAPISRYEPLPPAAVAAPIVRPGEAISMGRALEGTVMAKGKTSFVPGATVTVMDSQRKEVATATADPGGQFRTGSLQLARYTVHVEDPQGRFFPRDLSGVDPIAGKLEIELEKGYVLSGTVTERGSGHSAAGVRVVLHKLPGREVVGSVLTGEGGAWQFGPLKPSRFEALADVPGGSKSEVQLLDDVLKLRLTIPDIVYCTGVVVRSGGASERAKPMANVAVRIIDSEGKEVGAPLTNADGIFALAAPPPGTYGVRVSEPGGDGHGEAMLVVPPTGTPKSVRVMVEGPGRISGTVDFPKGVVDESEVRVWLVQKEDDEEPLQVAYLTNGVYAFAGGVSPGIYFVRALVFLPNKELKASKEVHVAKDARLVVDFKLE